MKITFTLETTKFPTNFLHELATITDNAELLSELAKIDNWEVQCAVANNPITSPTTLSELAKVKNPVVKSVVARHPNTSTETLSELAKDEDDYVREPAKRNPNFKK